MNTQYSNSTPTHLIELVNIDHVLVLMIVFLFFLCLLGVFNHGTIFCCKLIHENHRESDDSIISTTILIDSDAYREPLAPGEIINEISSKQNSHSAKGEDSEQDSAIEEVEDDSLPGYNQLC
jgi:hypothetical protein